MRYSQPALGFFWAFLSPLLTVVVFYLVFSVILKFEIKGIPFFLYLMSAIFPWNFFSSSVISSTTSLLDNKNLIRESNFAHYLIPLSIVLANGINFLPSLCVMIITAIFLLKGATILIIFLPAVILLYFLSATGLSILFSLFYVKWRDTRYILDLALAVLFYLTPAFYSFSAVQESFAPLAYKIYLCNPFVGLLSLHRITLLRGFYPLSKGDFSLPCAIVSSVFFALGTLVLAFYVYQKNKNSINDHLSY